MTYNIKKIYNFKKSKCNICNKHINNINNLLECISNILNKKDNAHVVITGAIGSGKTTLWNEMVDNKPSLQVSISPEFNKDCSFEYIDEYSNKRKVVHDKIHKEENACNAPLYTSLHKPHFDDADLVIVIEPYDISLLKKHYIERDDLRCLAHNMDILKDEMDYALWITNYLEKKSIPYIHITTDK